MTFWGELFGVLFMFGILFVSGSMYLIVVREARLKKERQETYQHMRTRRAVRDIVRIKHIDDEYLTQYLY